MGICLTTTKKSPPYARCDDELLLRPRLEASEPERADGQVDHADRHHLMDHSEDRGSRDLRN
ncbi:hypothetical protein [Shimazuella kribbensis]|uniref:hypothetical protein n=1 Tax=Shimazuella kribbensis TaxID=139808 RepID=UPI0003F5AAA8|nr:hypothetical protein [Shimazuella kribbensis]